MIDETHQKRRKFFLQAQRDRYDWAKRVDPMAVRAFEIKAEQNRKYQGRKEG